MDNSGSVALTAVFLGARLRTTGDVAASGDTILLFVGVLVFLTVGVFFSSRGDTSNVFSC